MTSSAEPEATRPRLFGGSAATATRRSSTRPARPLRQRLRLPLMLAGPVVVLLVAALVVSDERPLRRRPTTPMSRRRARWSAPTSPDGSSRWRCATTSGCARPGAVPDRRPTLPDRGRGGQGAARGGEAAGQGDAGDLSPEAGRGRRRRRKRWHISSASTSASASSPATGVRGALDLRPGAERMQVARQKVAVGAKRLANMLAQLGGNPDLPIDGTRRCRSAQAALDKAELDLSCTMVRAPRNRHRDQGRPAAGRVLRQPRRPRYSR